MIDHKSEERMDRIVVAFDWFVLLSIIGFVAGVFLL